MTTPSTRGAASAPTDAGAGPLMRQLDRVPRPIRFVVVGGSSTLASLVVFHAALAILGTRARAAALAQVLCYVAGMALGYTANRRWTFDAHAHHDGGQLVRFVTVQLLLAGASAVLVETGITRLGLQPTVCWFLVLGVTMGASYALQRGWVFASRRTTERGVAAPSTVTGSANAPAGRPSASAPPDGSRR